MVQMQLSEYILSILKPMIRKPVKQYRENIPFEIGSKLRTVSEPHSCSKNVTQPEPFIVPPIWNKTDYHKTISNVWAKAAEELSGAEYILVSGYSLPKTDEFFRYLYALGSIGESRIKEFWVYDPDLTGNVRQRYESLLGGDVKGKLNFQSEKFRKFIEDIDKRLERFII